MRNRDLQRLWAKACGYPESIVYLQDPEVQFSRWADASRAVTLSQMHTLCALSQMTRYNKIPCVWLGPFEEEPLDLPLETESSLPRGVKQEQDTHRARESARMKLQQRNHFNRQPRCPGEGGTEQCLCTTLRMQ